MKSLNKKEIKELERKQSLPVKRNSEGTVIPTKFTERELNHVIFVQLEKVRKENFKKFGGPGIQKHWGKQSKAERIHQERLERGEGTSGSRPMNI